jgi:RHS repeat-associated protein
VQTDANGLLYMRARFYNPYLCRFLNADPSGFSGGLNCYAFADGNPITMADPFGLGAMSAAASSWVPYTPNPMLESMLNGPSMAEQMHYQETVATLLNIATLGLANEAAITFGGADLQGNTVSGRERLATAVGFAAAFIPAERLASAGSRVATGAAKRGIGRSVNAPNFYSVPNQGGGRVWLSTTPVDQADFARLVTAGQREGRVTVLTGTHGTPGGALVPERAFFQEDLATWASQTANVKLIDVTRLSPRQMQIVMNRDGRVVCGWCYSGNSTAVQSALAP